MISFPYDYIVIEMNVQEEGSPCQSRGIVRDVNVNQLTFANIDGATRMEDGF